MIRKMAAGCAGILYSQLFTNKSKVAEVTPVPAI